MERALLSLVALAFVAFTGAFLVVTPRIARRGLLFGVYVGEAASEGGEAERLKAGWTHMMLAWLGLALVVGWLVMRRSHPLAAGTVALIVLLTGYYVEYMRRHRQARALASEAPPSVAVAYVPGRAAARPLLPWLAVACGLLGGAAVLAYTWMHSAQLPEQVPVHFNLAGQPDRYRTRSFGSVWVLPLLTLVQGTLLGVVALLITSAKRAVRRDDGGVSFAAQQRFRATVSSFLAVVAMLTTALLATLSIGAVRVAVGAAATLPSLTRVVGILIGVVAAVGVPFLALHLGQGGARLEQARAEAPLTNGLADNRRWTLGLFYCNPEDPSLFVEHRFGFGYTLNFGNRKAVAFLVLFLALTLGLAFAPWLLR